MKMVPLDKWQPCAGIALEEAADTAVRCSDNHMLVIAGPGAGKTELLAQKAAFLFQTNQCKDPQKILAISFKTDAAQNLKERVEARCGIEIRGRFVSMTYDAFAKSILDHFMYALPKDLCPASDYLVNDPDIIEAAFRYVGYKNPDNLSPSRLSSFYDASLARVNIPITGNEISHRVWPLLLRGFNGNKATLTFKMIMMLAMYIVKTNPYIKRALQMTYAYVFLDEFQDTTDLQYAFLKECFFGSGTKITAVGDNKQRIMGWAGALKGIFNLFCQELNPEGIRLTMNHRSAPRLVSLQKAMYTSLKEQRTEVNVSDKWNAEDGEIVLVVADNERLEAETVVADILNRIAEGTKPSDMCILCKQLPQNYSTVIISELDKHGVRARIETDYQDLIKEPIVDLLLKFLLCAHNRKHPNEWNFVEETLVELWAIGAAQGNDAYDEMQTKLVALADNVGKLMQQGPSAMQWHDMLVNILNFFDIAKLKAKYPAYKQGDFLESLINRFEGLFWTEYTATSGEWHVAIENFCGEHSIPIMTVHKSKGLEYSAVYFVGLEDSAFWNFRNQPDEDRCAFFVALSRAKESIMFTFCKQRSSMRYPTQRHHAINEFFELLQKPGIAKVVNVTANPMG